MVGKDKNKLVPLSVIYGQYLAPTGFRTRIDLLRNLLMDSIGAEGDWLVLDRGVKSEVVNTSEFSTEVIIPRDRSISNLLRHYMNLRFGRLPGGLSGNYDFLLAHSFNSLFPAVALKKKLKLPVILDVHGVWLDEVISKSKYGSMLESWFKYIEKTTYNYADGFIFASSVLGEVLRERYPFISRKPSIVVPNGVDSGKFVFCQSARLKLRTEWGWNNCVVIVHSGIHAPWVDIAGTVQFMETCRDFFPDVRFLFLSSDSNKWVKLFEKHSLESVARCMSVQHEKVPHYLSAADIGLVTRLSSMINKVASPTKIAEYLSIGLPVLMTAGIGDYDDLIVNDDLGFIVSSLASLDKKDASTIIDKLMNLDRDHIKTWAKNNLDIGILGKEFAGLISTVIKTPVKCLL